MLFQSIFVRLKSVTDNFWTKRDLSKVLVSRRLSETEKVFLEQSKRLFLGFYDVPDVCLMRLDGLSSGVPGDVLGERLVK